PAVGAGRDRPAAEVAPRLAALCGELAAYDLLETVQHDDLHMANVYAHGGRLRRLDWGAASISHPFASLVVTFRFLEERNQLPPADPWFGRLRDAYLEPWGNGRAGVFALAIRVGAVAPAIAWAPAPLAHAGWSRCPAGPTRWGWGPVGCGCAAPAPASGGWTPTRCGWSPPSLSPAGWAQRQAAWPSPPARCGSAIRPGRPSGVWTPSATGWAAAGRPPVGTWRSAAPRRSGRPAGTGYWAWTAGGYATRCRSGSSAATGSTRSPPAPTPCGWRRRPGCSASTWRRCPDRPRVSRQRVVAGCPTQASVPGMTRSATIGQGARSRRASNSMGSCPCWPAVRSTLVRACQASTQPQSPQMADRELVRLDRLFAQT